jgi:hypothetical protein
VEVIEPLEAVTNKYYNQYLDTFDSDGRCSQLSDVTVQKAKFFAHNNRNWT